MSNDASDIEQELKGLLDEIEDDVVPSDHEKPAEPDAVEEAEAEPAELADRQLQLIQNELVDGGESQGINVNEFFHRYDTVTREVLDACRSDRAEVTE